VGARIRPNKDALLSGPRPITTPVGMTLLSELLISIPQAVLGFSLQKCVIPTGAYPDFLPRSTARVRLSLEERRMRSANATKVHRKSGVAKWRDLLFLFRFSHTLLARALIFLGAGDLIEKQTQVAA
jgi:hypothetical protein